MNESKMIKDQIAALKRLEGKSVETGWFESDRYDNGDQVAYIARIVNFGCVVDTGKMRIVIPARPFMNKAYESFVQKRRKLESGIAKKLISGSISPDQALEQIGLFIEGEIVKSIRDGEWQPNADSTIAKKGFDKPLIDTSHMWKTVNSKIS